MTYDYARRITQDEAERILGRIESLLTRHVATCHVGQDPLSLVDLYRASQKPVMRAAYDAVCAWGAADGRIPVCIQQQTSVGILITVPSGQTLGLQVVGRELGDSHAPLLMLSSHYEMQPVVVSEVLSEAETDKLSSWAVNYAEIVSRATASYQVAEKIVEMCNTVGQLHRVCPDLVRYTYGQTVEALKQQQRRSPLPAQWHQIDRARMHDMLNHLGLCYLLPEDLPAGYPRMGFRGGLENVTCAVSWGGWRHLEYCSQLMVNRDRLSKFARGVWLPNKGGEKEAALCGAAEF